MAPNAGATPRYRFVHALGMGAMGSVDLVHDELRGHLVARKRLRLADPGLLLRFKREFRAIQPLAHDHLVRLYELAEDDAGPFFTMEAVDGPDLRAHCAGERSSELLLDALPDIVRALAFLHEHGVVHRDLKPSHVLVRGDGVLKILDFGVIAEIGSARGASDVAGTPGYMAPEQLRGEAASPATDAYALGAMIFELAAGRPVFGGARDDVLQAHLAAEPPRLADVAPGAPALLDEICSALLRKEPRERPTLDALLSRLAPARAYAPARSGATSLVGRAEIQRELAARVEAPGLVGLDGPTGSGKSALLAWLSAALQSEGVLVLSGAARPSERVAFNALDGVVDDLARALERDTALPADVVEAAVVASAAFPVLGVVGPDAKATIRRLVRYRLFGRRDAHRHTREQTFEGVARLLARVAERGRVVLLLDDFQWADDDSVALLSYCVESRRVPVAVVVASRDDEEGGAGMRWIAGRPELPMVRLPPLADRDVASLVRRAAGASAVSDADVAEAVSACAGRPFLAEVAGRALATGRRLDSGVAPLLDGTSARDRGVIALLVAADEWIPFAELAKLSRATLGEVDDAVTGLSHAGLVRRRGVGGLDGAVDLYHHGVRAAALAALDRAALASAHDALACELTRRPGAAPERVVRHLVGAGREREAAVYARDAAHAAEQQRAFGLAADMYAVALGDPSAPVDELTEARARALERVGRYEEAAACWSTLAGRRSGEARVDDMAREAHALIAANRLRAGLSRLDDVLAATGAGLERAGGVGAVAAAARFVAGALGGVGVAPKRADAASAGRAERDVKIAVLLSFVDPAMGLRFLQRAQQGFARAGNVVEVASCDYVFAVLALVGGRGRAAAWIARRYKAIADRRVAGLAVRAEVRGKPLFIEGLAALREGRWDEARARLGEAAEIFIACEGTTERLMALSWAMMADAYTQDIAALRGYLAAARRTAREHGDTFIVAHVDLCDAYTLFLEGHFVESRRRMGALAAELDPDRPNTQRAARLLYLHVPDVFLDDGRRARREFARAVESTRRYRFFDSMFAGPFAATGALLEANALRSGDRGASARRVERFAAICDAAPPLVAGQAWRARAYAADAAGRPEEALGHLARAEREAARFGRRLDRLVARYQRGVRLGGDEGAALCADARASAVAMGSTAAALEEDAGLR